ncbi:RagB/SusD family nutrient uptake outer membrane protein, partial [Parapedobacter sp. SGR-10]|uniref:RagB/SusD family nutrient uptake outer membrane protein n=1 Tax=Parapedobacter sp. SGR-10 TaxID=2710879 RepID=UPI0013D65DF7
MYRIISALIILLALSSCNKSFLDVSKQLAEEMDMEKIFSNPNDVRKFHRTLYDGIPNTLAFTWWSEMQKLEGSGNPYAHSSDDLHKAQLAFPYTNPINGSSSTHLGVFHRWSKYYKLIRQANLFLEHVKEIPVSGSADFLGAGEVAELKAQARFLRAYYHYLLFELYGPIPIMDFAVDPSDEVLDFKRNTVDEVVDFVYSELTAIASELKDPHLTNQEMLAVPTKGAALAVRARLMVYAASPLFNGGNPLALTLVDKEGQHLFPQKDDTKWQKAVTALEEFINYANSGHYELHKAYNNGVLDPHMSIYEVHTKMNKEIIMARSEDNLPASFRIDSRNIPRGARGGSSVTGGIAVTQELVDAFFMVDGLSKDESTLYSEDGYSMANEDLSGQTEVGTQRMYINREPRFYNTVFYNGRKWHIGNEQIWFYYGGNSGKPSTRYPWTGHLLYKRMDRRAYDEGSNLKPADVYKAPVVFRLAEFYLLYAEALNEVNPGDSKIIEYIDKVRERAGIPSYRELHDDGIKTDVVGNQEAQRTAIRQEMRVELATEGQRFHDLRRWLIAA